MIRLVARVDVEVGIVEVVVVVVVVVLVRTVWPDPPLHAAPRTVVMTRGINARRRCRTPVSLAHGILKVLDSSPHGRGAFLT